VTAGILLDRENQTAELKMGGYVLSVKHDYTWGWSGGDKDAETWPQAGGIIISTGQGEYVMAGSGFIVTFETETNGETAGILNIQQGSFKDGKWVGERWLNGDENHQGRHVRLPFGDFEIQRVRLYRYK
jgi:beta-galactosidase GanA